MIDGEMLFELEGEAPRVLRAGDAFWRPGGDRHAVIGRNLAIGRSERCKGRPLPPRPRLTVAGLGLDGRARTASTLRFGCAADTDHRRGRKLQRLRPPRWTSHRVSATEATTTATSRMFVTRAIYLEQGASWSMTLTPSRSEIETAGNERD